MQPSSLSLSADAASLSAAKTADAPKKGVSRSFAEALTGAKHALDGNVQPLGGRQSGSSAVVPLGGKNRPVQSLSRSSGEVRVLGSSGKGGEDGGKSPFGAAILGLEPASGDAQATSDGQKKGSGKKASGTSSSAPSEATQTAASKSEASAGSGHEGGKKGKTAPAARSGAKVSSGKNSGGGAQTGGENTQSSASAKGTSSGSNSKSSETSSSKGGQGQGQNGRAASEGKAGASDAGRRATQGQGGSGAKTAEGKKASSSREGTTKRNVPGGKQRAGTPKAAKQGRGEASRSALFVKGTSVGGDSPSSGSSSSKGHQAKGQASARTVLVEKGLDLSQQRRTAEARSVRLSGEKPLKATPKNKGAEALTPKKAPTAQSREGSARAATVTADEVARRTLSADASPPDRSSRTGSAKRFSKEGAPVRSKRGAGHSGSSGEGNTGQQRGGQGTGQNSGGRHRQGRGQTNGKNDAARPLSLSTSARERGSTARTASPEDLFPGGKAGSDASGKRWTSALSDMNSSTPSGKGGRTGSASGPPRTLPTAWLKTAAQGPLRTAELASGWKAMELSLGQENGSVTVKARSDQDGMAVSVNLSDPRLRSQIAANARQLQETMQGQYGSDVDLSFGGGDAGTSGDQTPDESATRSGAQASTSSDRAAEKDASDDPVHRRGPHGGREWIG